MRYLTGLAVVLAASVLTTADVPATRPSTDRPAASTSASAPARDSTNDGHDEIALSARVQGVGNTVAISLEGRAWMPVRP